MKEIFKDILWFEWIYQVSNLGNVKSFRDNRGNHREKVLQPIKNSTWYVQFNLMKWHKRSIKSQHRLMMETFIPNTENKKEVNHINWIKNDNRLENLEWVTTSENRIHAFATGLEVSTRGKKILNLITWEIYRTTDIAAKELWCCRETVRLICSNKYHKSIRYSLSYAA